jgi:hypothetical protein
MPDNQKKRKVSDAGDPDSEKNIDKTEETVLALEVGDTSDLYSKENSDKAKEIVLALDVSDHARDKGLNDEAIAILMRIAKLYLFQLRNQDASRDWARLRKDNQAFQDYKKMCIAKVDALERYQDGERIVETEEKGNTTI